ncbi:hypothetical protein, partial [Mycobacteroides abscessus]|uniref:hypothetical protein n=1 Tax=Mycobacteroides abscessus TaxID=36809 RepID=UPI001A9798E8
GAVKPGAVAEGAQGGGVPLRDALGMYLSIYGLVLAALGALVYILGRVLRAESLYRVVGWLAGLYGAVLVIWVALLQLLKGSVAGLESAIAPGSSVSTTRRRVCGGSPRSRRRWSRRQGALGESSFSAMRRRCRLRGASSVSDWSAEPGSSRK